MSPQIQEYDQQISAPGPFDTRQARNEDTGDVGAAITNIGRAIGNAQDAAEKHQAQAEVSDVGTQLAQLHADKTISLDNTLKTADPADGDVTNKFMSDFDDSLQDISGNIQTDAGRKYFDAQAAKMRSQFLVSAANGQSQLAGAKAVSDYTTSLNNYSTSAESNPAGMDDVMDQHETQIKAMVASGSLDQVTALKIQTEGEKQIAESAAKGWMDINPAYAKERIQAGDFDDYVDGTQKFTLLKEADQAVNAERIGKQQQDKAIQDALAKAQTATQNSFLEKMSSGQLTSKQILNSNLDPFGSGSKEQMLKMLDQTNQEGAKTNPATFNALFARINAPEGDPQKITNENDLNPYLGQGLSLPAIKQLREEIQGRGTEQGKSDAALRSNFLDGVAKGQIIHGNKQLGIQDPQGEANYQRFISDLYNTEASYRQQGKPLSGLYSPSSPDYAGKYIPAYANTMQQALSAQVQQMSRVPNPTATLPAANQSSQQSGGSSSSAGSPSPMAPTSGVGGVNAPSTPKLRTVSTDEINQYAAKHGIKAEDAKSYLGSLGYATH